MQLANPPTISYGSIQAVAASDYLPLITQSGAVSTYSTQVGHYFQIGKKVDFWGKVVINNAGGAVAGNIVSVSLPPAALARFDQANYAIGTCSLYDLSATQMFKGIMVLQSNATVLFLPSSDASVDATNFHLGAKIFTAILQTGDIIAFSGSYEAA